MAGRLHPKGRVAFVNRRGGARQRGYTLVEIIISIMLTALMVSSVFSVALTSKTGGGKQERKLVAAEATRQLSARLKNFVKDPTGNTSGILGPGSGADRWSLDDSPVNDCGPSCGAPSCTNCYALAPGVHELQGFLPVWFTNAPYNARISYDVISASPYNVQISVNWTDP